MDYFSGATSTLIILDLSKEEMIQMKLWIPEKQTYGQQKENAEIWEAVK